MIKTRYVVICKDCTISEYVHYLHEPARVRAFESKEAAQEWIKKHSYKGMSFRYEVVEV